LIASDESYDAETGLLSPSGLEQAVESELARASRHEIPVSLVYMEVSAAAGVVADPAAVRRLAARVAEALLGAVRAEDRVARLATLRFAVLAAETGDSRALAGRLEQHVDRHLGALSGDTTLAVAAVDCQFDEMSREQLMVETERQLAATILRERDITFPPPAPPAPREIRHTG
jgi:GGDEF domain-containing protein